MNLVAFLRKEDVATRVAHSPVTPSVFLFYSTEEDNHVLSDFFP